MNPAQQAFLQQIASKIPRLFAAIAAGNVRAEFILGQRVIKGRQVRLKLVAEVVDPGANPLATHGRTMGLPAEPAAALPSDAELLRLSGVRDADVEPVSINGQSDELVGAVPICLSAFPPHWQSKFQAALPPGFHTEGVESVGKISVTVVPVDTAAGVR